MEIEAKREIVVRDYAGPGRHIYKDQLGWGKGEIEEARSLVSKEIWEYEICMVGLNIAFYYPGNDTYYGLHTECYPHFFYELPRFRDRDPYIAGQCDKDTHDGGKPLYVFDNIWDVWDTVKIDGISLEDVLDNSYIVMLS